MENIALQRHSIEMHGPHDQLWQDLIDICRESRLPQHEVVGILTRLVGDLSRRLFPTMPSNDLADNCRALIYANLIKRDH